MYHLQKFLNFLLSSWQIASDENLAGDFTKD